jgi:hypothetical protein
VIKGNFTHDPKRDCLLLDRDHRIVLPSPQSAKIESGMNYATIGSDLMRPKRRDSESLMKHAKSWRLYAANWCGPLKI